MSDYTTPQMMLMIQALSPSANVSFSKYTRNWYVEAKHLEIGNGSTLTGATEHRDTPEEAVLAYFARLITIDDPEFIVTDYRGHRREWRWNGAAFAEVTRPVAMGKG